MLYCTEMLVLFGCFTEDFCYYWAWIRTFVGDEAGKNWKNFPGAVEISTVDNCP
jgi:hypothetical protein